MTNKKESDTLNKLDIYKETTEYQQQVMFWQKVAQTKSKVGVVKKDGKVSFKSTNYNYQRAEDIELAVREACEETGLIIVPIGFEVVSDVNNIITTIQKFHVVDSQTGYFVECSMGGMGQDSGDKRIYKSETGAYKYFMKQFFQIPSEGTDPDLIPSEAYTVVNQSGAINWKDYVPKNGKYAGKRLEDIYKENPGWVKYMAGKAGDYQSYCVAAMQEMGN